MYHCIGSERIFLESCLVQHLLHLQATTSKDNSRGTQMGNNKDGSIHKDYMDKVVSKDCKIAPRFLNQHVVHLAFVQRW